MPVVKFFGRLDLEQIFLFLDRHALVLTDIDANLLKLRYIEAIAKADNSKTWRWTCVN